jgi:hypothetical protein
MLCFAAYDGAVGGFAFGNLVDRPTFLTDGSLQNGVGYRLDCDSDLSWLR